MLKDDHCRSYDDDLYRHWVKLGLTGYRIACTNQKVAGKHVKWVRAYNIGCPDCQSEMRSEDYD